MPRDLSQYVEVHVRIAQFWEKFPRGRIVTEVSYPDEQTVRCKASVYRENTLDMGDGNPIVDLGGLPPFATGHAEEKRGDGPVNRTSAVENCETSAVGRALAMAGFSIHKGIASREEVEIAQRKAEAQKNGGEAVSGPEKRPVRYVDFLRAAIRGYNQDELSDEAEWAKLVESASTKDKNARLVKSLEAALVEVGGNVERVRERYSKVQGQAS